LVEKFPTVFEKSPQVLGGIFLTHTVWPWLYSHRTDGRECRNGSSSSAIEPRRHSCSSLRIQSYKLLWDKNISHK